jgi:hypothetical protein
MEIMSSSTLLPKDFYASAFKACPNDFCWHHIKKLGMPYKDNRGTNSQCCHYTHSQIMFFQQVDLSEKEYDLCTYMTPPSKYTSKSSVTKMRPNIFHLLCPGHLMDTTFSSTAKTHTKKRNCSYSWFKACQVLCSPSHSLERLMLFTFHSMLAGTPSSYSFLLLNSYQPQKFIPDLMEDTNLLQLLLRLTLSQMMQNTTYGRTKYCSGEALHGCCMILHIIKSISMRSNILNNHE